MPNLLRIAEERGTLLSEETAIKFLSQEIASSDGLNPPTLIGVDHFLADPRFRAALRKYSSKQALIRKFGNPENYALLNLHPESKAPDIKNVSTKLEKDSPDLGLILLANDIVITRNQRELESLGFSFESNWQNPESDYRFLLDVTKKVGRRYFMERVNSEWTYRA